MFRAAFACLFACAVVLSNPSAEAQVLSRDYSGFTTPEAYLVMANGKSGPVSFNPFLSGLSAQDVDGDGKIDFLVTGIPSDSNLTGPITTTLLHNTGSGTFQQTRGNKPDYCIPPAVFWGPFDHVLPFCTLADLNGDGLADEIFAAEYPNKADSSEVDYPTIKVQFATGPGTFSAPLRYVLGGRHAYIAAVATGDFNGDGRQDIAVLRISQEPDPSTQQFYGFVILLLGNAQGGFTPTHSYATGVYNDIGQNGISGQPDLQMVALDLNGDGKSDLMVYPAPPVLSSLPNLTSPYAVLLGRADGLTLQVSPTASPFLLLAPADINHDGFGDLLAAEIDGFHVLLGGGANSPIFGYFKRDQKLSLGELGPHIMSMAASDMNGDGLPDLMVCDWDTVSIFFQKKDGTFADALQFAGGSSVGAVMADVNNDGHLDIVLEGNPLVILFGDGKGAFTGSRVTGNYYGGSIVTSDFNGDGNADVAIVSGGFGPQNFVDVFMGSGKGWFGPLKSYAVANIYTLLAAGDVNGDGIPDLVVENALPPYDAGQQGPDTSVLLGRKDGTFGLPIASYVGLGDIRGTQDVFLVDMNGDGRLDLITDAGVALGKGDGTFGTPIAFPIDPNANPYFTDVVVGDVNGDGKPDVLLTTTGRITVLMGDGTGNFSVGEVIDPRCGSECLPYLAIGKLNSDSSLDFVAAIVDPAGVTNVITYLNNGSGTFHEAQRVALTEPFFVLYKDFLNAVAIADITGDGINDVIVQSSAIGVLPGTGDGTLAAPIASAYPFGRYGSNAFAIADYNNDASLDLVMPAANGFGRVLNTGPQSWPSYAPAAARHSNAGRQTPR
jgi:FG-GAP-like repeat/FG-GAP repeat